MSGYRRGTVLGLTVAETFILLTFLLLFALLGLSQQDEPTPLPDTPNSPRVWVRPELIETLVNEADMARKAKEEAEQALAATERERDLALEEAEQARKAKEEAEQARAATERERSLALEEAEQTRAATERERDLALEEAEQARKAKEEAEQARAATERERSLALEEAEQTRAATERERDLALEEAEQARAATERERDLALEEAEQARAATERERDLALEEAEQARKAKEEAEQARAATERERDLALEEAEQARKAKEEAEQARAATERERDEVQRNLALLRRKGENPPCWYQIIDAGEGKTREKPYYVFNVAIYKDSIELAPRTAPPGGAFDDNGGLYADEWMRLRIDEFPYGKELNDNEFAEVISDLVAQGRDRQVRTYTCVFSVMVWDKTPDHAKKRWKDAHDRIIEGSFSAYTVQDLEWNGVES